MLIIDQGVYYNGNLMRFYIEGKVCPKCNTVIQSNQIMPVCLNQKCNYFMNLVPAKKIVSVVE